MLGAIHKTIHTILQPHEELRNNFANITLLSKQANAALRDREPSPYLEELYAADPALLKLHFIPEERIL